VIEQIADHALVFLGVKGTGDICHVTAGFEQRNRIGDKLLLLGTDRFRVGQHLRLQQIYTV
jgi:hypothetical protein